MKPPFEPRFAGRPGSRRSAFPQGNGEGGGSAPCLIRSFNLSTTLSSGPQRVRRNDLRKVRDSCRCWGHAVLTDSNLKALPPTQTLTPRRRRGLCWARHLSPRGGAQGLSPWLGPGRDASTQRATPTWKPPSRQAFPGHAAQPEAPPATATRWTQPLPRRRLQFDKITPTGNYVPDPAGAAGVLRSEPPRALQGSPAFGSGCSETDGRAPTRERFVLLPEDPIHPGLATRLARSLRAQRFHTLRRKDPPRPRHPAALLSFPTARSPRPHNPPFD